MVPAAILVSNRSSNDNTFWFQLGALDICHVTWPTFEQCQLWHLSVPINLWLGTAPGSCLESSENIQKYPLSMSGWMPVVLGSNSKTTCLVGKQFSLRGLHLLPCKWGCNSCFSVWAVERFKIANVWKSIHNEPWDMNCTEWEETVLFVKVACFSLFQ